jgi:hypothetical protein
MKISKSVDFICSIKEKIIKSEDLSVVELEHLDKIMTFFKVDKISSLILCLTVKKHFYGKRLNTSKLFDSLNYNLEQIIDLKNNYGEPYNNAYFEIGKELRKYYKYEQEIFFNFFSNSISLSDSIYRSIKRTMSHYSHYFSFFLKINIQPVISLR